jgi:nucleolar protein 12
MNAKDNQDEHEDQAKSYLTPAEKKRIAFIRREFHEEGATVNAYVVFAHPDPHRKESLPPVMDPFQAAAMIAKHIDGSSLMDRTLRVDRVGARRDGQPDEERDPSSTVFVGNLEFTANEEDVRSFFETLLVSEIGPPTQKIGENSSSTSQSGSEEDSESESPDSSHWVHSVRIVRDKDTQLGKGFAYIRFTVSLFPLFVINLFMPNPGPNLCG